MILCGGEALQPDLAAQLITRGTSVWNLYGPTETTIYSSAALCQSELSGGKVPIGRPIANTRIYLLDGDLRPVPIGVAGELYIGGAGVARGYLNRSDMTAEKFIPDPYSVEPGARLYRTGDLACYLLDGNIEYLGRIDHQVKIRGFRIELGEIESVLSQHPSVLENVVMAREDTSGNNRLVAYIITRNVASVTISALRDFLKEKLPDYMVPSAFVFLDSLPLTPNGKLDRTALPQPDQTRPELIVTFVAPRSPVEELLAGIWATVLKVEKVGVHDNFFEIGGHSLLAIRVISRVHDTFGLNLPVRSLFENPTIEGLANMIQTGKAGGSNSQVTAITPLPRQLYSVKQSG
jgi:acyl carrier protein